MRAAIWRDKYKNKKSWDCSKFRGRRRSTHKKRTTTHKTMPFDKVGERAISGRRDDGRSGKCSPVLRLPPFRESNEYIGMASVSLYHNTSLTWSLIMGGEMSQGISTSLFWMAHITFVGTRVAYAHTYTKRLSASSSISVRRKMKMMGKSETREEEEKSEGEEIFVNPWVIWEFESWRQKKEREAPLWVIFFFLVHSATQLAATTYWFSENHLSTRHIQNVES